MIVEQPWRRSYGYADEEWRDRGRAFLSKLMEEVYALVGIKKVNTTAYHPQIDGRIERFNRKLTSMLAKTVQKMAKTGTNICHTFYLHIGPFSRSRQGSHHFSYCMDMIPGCQLKRYLPQHQHDTRWILMITSRKWHLDWLMRGQLHKLMSRKPSVGRRLSTIDEPRTQRFMWEIVSSFLCHGINRGKPTSWAGHFRALIGSLHCLRMAWKLPLSTNREQSVALNRVRLCPREIPDTGEQASVERPSVDVAKGVEQQTTRQAHSATWRTMEESSSVPQATKRGR